MDARAALACDPKAFKETAQGWMGAREQVSHITVSGVWREKGTGVTCNGFWGLEGAREKVSHVTVSGVCREKGTSVTCNGFWGWRGQGNKCHM
jgi:hypothetical protein